MSDGKCAWCGAPLDGQVHTGLPVHDMDHYAPGELDPDDDRYCSAKCIEKRIDELFHRRKRWLSTGQEKWPRFTAEVPPELALLLDNVQRRHMGVNASSASRSGMVRAGLRLYLHEVAFVEEPAIEATADPEPPALEEQTAEVERFYAIAALKVGARVRHEDGRRGVIVQRSGQLWVTRHKSPFVRWDGIIPAEAVPWEQVIRA